MNDNTTTTLYLRKDGKHFDMRIKENKEFFNAIKKSNFDMFMQKVAIALGAPKLMGSHIHWSHWLNPKHQFKRVMWRLGYSSPYRLN